MVFDSPKLNDILMAELVAGNGVVETGPGFGGAARMVLLGGPFRTPRPAPGLGLEFCEVNDAHYWLAEVEDPATPEVLACRC
jgi:hypothetical protein